MGRFADRLRSRRWIAGFAASAMCLGGSITHVFAAAAPDQVSLFSTLMDDSAVQAADSAARAGLFEDGSTPGEVRVCRVTAYCDRGLTASGVMSGLGQCAAPGDVPFGSIVYIPALDRSFVVTDRTHKRFRHNTVDLFIPERAACLAFGREYLEVVITPPAQPYRYRCESLAALVERFADAAVCFTPADTSAFSLALAQAGDALGVGLAELR